MSGREWLRGIEIQNFRGIESLHLSFVGPDDKASPVVVVAGPNGCGKTTVLEACLLVAGEPSVTKELVTGAVDSRGVRRGAEDFIIRGFFEGDAGTNEADFGPVFSGNTRRLDCEYFSSWRAPVLPGALSVTAGKPGKRPRKEVKNRLWIVKQHLVNAKAYDRMSSQGPSNAPSKFDRAIDKVNQLWRMFYPDTEQTFSVEPAGESPDAGFDVFLNESGGRIPLDALSSGQLELFLLAGSALPGEEVPSLLCIDEPELHLDPQWHRLILRALQKLRPESQIIVGTHSPEIYEAVLSHQRHFLVPPDDPRAKVWSTPSSGAAKE